MGLAEAAKEAQNAVSSRELLWLREMRKYVNLWTPKNIDAEWGKVVAFDNSPESKDMDGQQRLCRMISEAGKKGRIAELYRKVLHYAEIAERKQKGGGEDFVRRARPLILERLAEIEARYMDEKEYQLTIKEGAADGNEKSRDCAAATAGDGWGQGGRGAESPK